MSLLFFFFLFSLLLQYCYVLSSALDAGTSINALAIYIFGLSTFVSFLSRRHLSFIEIDFLTLSILVRLDNMVGQFGCGH